MSRAPLARSAGVTVLIGLAVWCPAAWARGQWAPLASNAENQAIAYSTAVPADAVAALQQRLDTGSATLQHNAETGYLHAVLQALQVPTASQTLVFSRTSLQRELISPKHPRALYFNRDVYVGWVPGGRVLEIASIDAALGPVFYTLAQQQTARPRFERQTRSCLQCHDSPSSTGGVPGLLMKSVHVDERGEPLAASGAYVTTDRSPMKERWGGWYVTGKAGPPPHMGVDLPPQMDMAPYPTRHSDSVALMVLAHQTSVQNLMTRAGYRTRMAMYFDRQRIRDLGGSDAHVPEATRHLVASVSEPLVRAMLFVDEAPFDGPMPATFDFSKQFGAGQPRDRRGRSLFELDLTRRLLRYPCSYLIYSESFDALPAPAKEYVYRRLWEVLRGDDASETFAHLTGADRSAILEILRETKPEFATNAP